MKATRGGGYKGTEAEALGGAYVRCTIFDVRRWRLAAPMYEVRGTIWTVRRLRRGFGAWRRPVAGEACLCTMDEVRFGEFLRLRAGVAERASCHDFDA